jgi:ribonuclease J
LSDSTNAERPGYTQSERKVGESFDTLFRRANGKRIIIATFASNIHRVQQIIDISEQLNKKVALSGRSLENVVSIAQELGYLRIPKDLMITIDQVKRYSDDELVIITTGSQGEPLSALSRMASSDHRKIEITGNDCVIISATPIPGNEKTVNKVINEHMKLGAEVVYERMYDVHVSGHACQEELKILLGHLKPKFFIPVHGEHKHLRKHAQLALAMGVKEENVLIADNGNVIEFNRNTAVFCPSIPAGRVLVDGYGVGDVGSVVLRERKLLSQDGLIIVAAAVNLLTASMVSEPEILTRGFVYVKESEQLINEAVEVAKNTIKFCLGGVVLDIGIIKSRLREDLSKLMNDRTRRNPMVLPIIINVE